MATNWIEKVTGSLEQKKQYRHYQARKAALPGPSVEAITAIERYLNYFVETFLENYAEARWISKERARLTAAIERAEANERHESEPPQ
ncbi:hypothetical protein [Leucobacter salsicius]|uniref:hypothetical protein n=1 Tax=Leucobacter salsicius TaxID=664638 RepID=UPI000348AB71|nr:hypothetical protein [Leucobacter salsicius]